MFEEYRNGYLERNRDGAYVGTLKIEGIDISPVEGQYFKKDGETYLWLKRRPILEYSQKTGEYTKREREPRWECYLKKQLNEDAVAFKGEFVFMRFRFEITGVWDDVLGNEKNRLLNLYVERLKMSQQTIINNINERKRNGTEKRRRS